MKLHTLSLLLVSIVMFSAPLVSAQSPGLKVGDKAPVMRPYKWVKGEPIKEFKKGQVYIIELGATWCKPCAAMIPQLTSLAKQYEQKVKVLGVFVMEYNPEPVGTKFPKYVSKVENYVKKKGEEMNYHVAVDDPGKSVEQTWLQAAGKVGIPYTFVIDKNGLIAWIGANPEALKKVVEFVLKDDYHISQMVKAVNEQDSMQRIMEKTDMLLSSNGRIAGYRNISALSPCKAGQPCNSVAVYIRNYDWLSPGSEDEVYKGTLKCEGLPLEMLYYIAYGDTVWDQFRGRNSVTLEYPDTVKWPHQKSAFGIYWHKPVIEVQDSTPFIWSYKIPANRFNYFLQVPKEKSSSIQMQQIMRRNLQEYFNYEVNLEERMMPYWSIFISSKDRLPPVTPQRLQKFSISENDDGSYSLIHADMRDIIWMLASNFGYKEYSYDKMPFNDQASFIDETGITGQFNFSIDLKDSFRQFREYLQSIGIGLEKKYRKMKVVVIRDAKK